MLRLVGSSDVADKDRPVEEASVDLACAVLSEMAFRRGASSDEQKLLEGVVDLLEAAALLCPRRGADQLGFATKLLRNLAAERGIDTTDEADQSMLDQQLVEKCVEELSIGDMVDPESCFHLKSLPFAEDVYARVRHVWCDEDDIRVFYDSFDVVVYRKGARVLVVKRGA